MTDQGRFIPPSTGRTAAAARKGVFPRSRMLVMGMALLSAAGAAFLFEAQLAHALASLFEEGMAAAIRKDTDVEQLALRAISTVIPVLLCLCVAPFIGGMLGAWLPVLVFKRGKGSTAVPIPEIRSVKWEMAGLRLFGTAAFLTAMLLSLRALRAAPPVPQDLVAALGHFLLQSIGILGGVLILLGTGEMLLMRLAIHRALFLNRGESRREEQALRGSRETVRRGRQQARTETAQ